MRDHPKRLQLLGVAFGQLQEALIWREQVLGWSMQMPTATDLLMLARPLSLPTVTTILRRPQCLEGLGREAG